MFQLLSTPEKFDGKRVSVIGFIEFGREKDLLYPLQEYAINVIVNDAIGVERSEKMGILRKTLDKKYVRLVGTFKIQNKSVTSPPGYLIDIENCDVWSDPRSPLSDKIRSLPGVEKHN